MTDKTLYFIVLMIVGAILLYKYMSIVYDEHKDNERQKQLDKALQAYFEYLDRARERRKHELAQQTQHNMNTISKERMEHLYKQMQITEQNK